MITPEAFTFCEAFVHSFEFTIVAESERSRNSVRSKLWMKSWNGTFYIKLIVNMCLRDGFYHIRLLSYQYDRYCQNKWRIILCQEWFKSPVFRHAVLISPNYWRPHWITVILDHLIPSFLLLLIHAIKTKNHDHSTNNWWLWKINTAVSAVFHSPLIRT